MSLPNFPTNDPSLTREEVINQIISSIAMEELALSHIINAEGEKLQYALGTIPGVTGPTQPATMEDLLKLNESIRETLDSTMQNQMFLKAKMQDALTSSVMQGPTGPTGPQGAAGEQGPQGPTGPSFIRQPFANSNILQQTIEDFGSVKYSNNGFVVNGIGYNGTDTFTVITPGIYVLQCVLNLATNNDAGTMFSIYVDSTYTAPAANALNAGPIVIFLVQYYTANMTVRIINVSGHDVSIAQGGNDISSAGHFAFYRIADDGVT